MRILVVATKSPWPACDGGRLALLLTLEGLAAAGHELALVAPVEAPTDAELARMTQTLRAVCAPTLVPVQRRSWPSALQAALRGRTPASIERHRHAAVADAVEKCIVEWNPHVVHVEQLQALANFHPLTLHFSPDLPVVLRMQNVESALWAGVARQRLWLRPLLLEAARVRRAERRALAKVTRVVALTEADAQALRTNADAADADRIVAVAPPFPPLLPAGAPVAGEPALALAGSAGWWPNRQGGQWFLDTVLPSVLAALPGVQCHVYGGAPVAHAGTCWHPAPTEAIDAFPANAIAVVPLHVASGVRVRILEAWARGLPVVATRVAAAGLQITSGVELLIADSAAEFAAAIEQVAGDTALRERLVTAGRATLAREHAAAVVIPALVGQYELTLRENFFPRPAKRGEGRVRGRS